MANTPNLDLELAHEFFSAHCFNSTWELIDKTERTEPENEQMIQCVMTSLWHWTWRSDCTDKHLSIGYWQAARVYALVGEKDNSRKYAQLCLDITPANDAFCLGYAHEAMARAESLSGGKKEAEIHLTQARELAKLVTNANDRNLLEADLDALT